MHRTNERESVSLLALYLYIFTQLDSILIFLYFIPNISEDKPIGLDVKEGLVMTSILMMSLQIIWLYTLTRLTSNRRSYF